MNYVFYEKFKTDGELYDVSLTRDTQKEAFKLYGDILDWINRYGSADILDIVCLISHFPAPRNLIYARSHGYNRFDIANFTVRPANDGNKWGVYLGNPRKLW